jgi:transposase-like protein
MVDGNHEPITREASKTMVVRDACPECGSRYFKKNGHIHTGKQNHQCRACDRQFVVHADNRVIAEDQRTLVERLLCEKISLHGICRAVGVSIRWLMDFMITRFKALPDHLHVQSIAPPRAVIIGRIDVEAVIIGRIDVEADEMWSFVKQKANKQWV